MSRVLDLADRLWSGAATVDEHHPFAPLDEVVEVAPGVAFVSSFANATVFATDAGLVVVDGGGLAAAQRTHELIRSWSDAPVHTVIYSHGHVDHVFGAPLFDAEADAAGRPRPRVVAHEAVLARFERYRETAGWNAAINARQFQVPGLTWPTEYRAPDLTYRDRLDLDVGGERFELRHARAETDDHTWTWCPRRRVVASGDLVIWAVPNAGNPQKVQRYPREWARALRAIEALGAEALAPGHGVPVVGADRVRAICADTAELLESLWSQTVALMNEGRPLEEVVHAVEPPPRLLEKPYLRPVYDEPEFVVRNVWRQLGGWWGGDPALLKPAPPGELARELAALAGGAERLAARAAELAEAGELRLAAHLAELAHAATGGDAEVERVRADVYERRLAAEPSTMAKGVFAGAAAEARRLAGG